MLVDVYTLTYDIPIELKSLHFAFPPDWAHDDSAITYVAISLVRQYARGWVSK